MSSKSDQETFVEIASNQLRRVQTKMINIIVLLITFIDNFYVIIFQLCVSS